MLILKTFMRRFELYKQTQRFLNTMWSFYLFTAFGPERDEVTGEWRRLHNKELHALYSSPNTIRVIK
jgi:hypothetical protein